MHNRVRSSLLVVILALPAFAAAAQTAPPSPDSLKLAGELVEKTQGDRASTLAAISQPMVGMMQQMGIRQPDRAQAMVQEAIMPVLTDHYSELLTMQATTLAAVLSVDDMKAVVAFYDTPAGKHLIAAQPQMAQARITGMTQWMGTLQPELQTKIQATLKAHGWDKG